MKTSILKRGGDLVDDKGIIELYEMRDERAIRQTADKYGRYCFGVAKNILPSEQDCEECVNDTYVRVWNSIPPKKPSNFRLFLARITRNLAIDRVKRDVAMKRGGGEFALALEEIGDIASDDDTVEKDIEYSVLVRRINEFLRSISERDCNVFVSRYFYIESISTISRKYSLSEANVHKILSRVRVGLKEYLRAEGYEI